MLEYPDECHRFLGKITKAVIQAAEHFRRVIQGHRGVFGIAEDAAQMMSPDMFGHFCVPYADALYSRFGAGLRNGRGMHMCGDSVHLHKSLVEDLRISSFNVFGYPVAPEVAARNLPGVYLWGNINPMFLLEGTKEEVKAAATAAIKGMAPNGGFMLGDGANVCPGTPIENLAALTKQARNMDYQRYCHSAETANSS